MTASPGFDGAADRAPRGVSHGAAAGAADRIATATARRTPGLALRISAFLGLLVGFAEVIVLTLRHTLSTPIMGLTSDYVWMTPLATTILATAAALGGFVIGRWIPRLDGFATAMLLACCAAALELLLLVPRLHLVATAILALGVGAQLARVVSRSAARAAGIAARGVPALGLAVVLLAVLPELARAVREARAAEALPDAPTAAPNILFITLDTVRGASLGLYGYERSTSPFLEELGEDGVVFEHAISPAPWTLPSHASLFTGRWHHELPVSYRLPLPDAYPTLAERLRAHGYATAGFVANFQYCGYETGLDQGFIHYEDFELSWGELLTASRIGSRVSSSFRLRALIGTDQHASRKSADELNTAFLAWLDEAPARPFFAFLNYFDAHEPYLPPAPWDTRFGPPRARGDLSPLHRWLYDPAANHANMGPGQVREEIDAYNGAIAYVDDRLRTLVEALRTRETDRETLIVVTSDHGEEFGEHGVFEHGYSLYRAGVRIPLLVAGPGVPAGVRVAAPVSTRNVPATVLDLVGIEPGPIGGRSLRTRWTGDGVGAAPIYSEVEHAPNQPDWFPVSEGDMRSVLVDGLRYILNGDGGEELYDYFADPDESRDLATDATYGEALDRARALVPRPRIRPIAPEPEEMSVDGRARSAGKRPPGRDGERAEISVVVPCYRSADCLPELARRVGQALAGELAPYELILVDDRSPDGSWEVIEELAADSPSVIGVRLRKNVGQDNAIMAGLHQATGRAVVIMDDDLQHDPADIPALHAKLREGHDVVYGRFPRKRQALWKNAGSLLNDRVAALVLGKPKHIYLSPFKVIDGDVVEEILRYRGPFAYVDGLIFTITSSIDQVNVTHHDRFAGESNYNLIRSIKVWLKLATSFSVLPLRIATMTGIALSAVSFLMGAYFLLEALFLARTPEGWASLIVAVFFLGGVQLMGIGALGEYVGRTFITQNRRPQFAVQEVRGAPDRRLESPERPKALERASP